MKNSTKVTGATIAAAAALLFGSVTVTAAGAEEAKIKCEGANACKGHSECATAKNACSGQNACKGQGYLLLSKTDCDAAKTKMKDEKKS
jgi:hypothetical protein